MTVDKKSVLLLHGWPGTSDDFQSVRSFLPPIMHVVAPDLAGFGEGFKGMLTLGQATARAHADRLLELIDAERLQRPIVAGYDIGSRIAQAIALQAPEKIGGLVLTPGYPGIGDRAMHPDLQSEFWYQHFHRLDVTGDTLDGNREALTAYIRHFLSTWSYESDIESGDRFEKVINYYVRPNAFRASIAWYGANQGYVGSGRIVVPTTMLWPENDPLFPLEWSDRLPEYFAKATLKSIPNCGHFVPLEAPENFAKAIQELIKDS